MQDIDFLPVEYRQQHVRRQAQPWQIVVAVVFAALLAGAMFAQHYRRHYAEEQLAAITPVYDAAVVQQSRLSEIQTRLKAAGATAELYTYLRHPWPRSQLLTALLTPLPDEITLQQVQIVRAAPQSAAPNQIQMPVDKKAEEEKLKAMTPAERDLTQLRQRLDPLQTTIIITGAATESAALHRYLGEMDAKDIFAKAELDSFASVDNGKGGAIMQFRATLVLRPGYGQAGGPTAPPKKDVAQNHREQPPKTSP